MFRPTFMLLVQNVPKTLIARSQKFMTNIYSKVSGRSREGRTSVLGILYSPLVKNTFRQRIIVFTENIFHCFETKRRRQTVNHVSAAGTCKNFDRPAARAPGTIAKSLGGKKQPKNITILTSQAGDY